MFKSKAKKEAEAREAAARADLQRAEQAKRNAERARREQIENAWRADRNAAIEVRHAAQREYAAARRKYEMYAPGPQKDAAGQAMNQAADRLQAANRAFKAVDDFRDWNRSRA
jgi:hypothetical protein